MKSKSFDLKQATTDKHSFDKTADFVGLYKSATESYEVAEKRKLDEIAKKEISKNKTITAKRERSPNKNKKKNKQELVELSQINIDGANITNSSFSSGSAGRGSPVNDLKVTSTPNTNGKNQGGKVKSIMKNKSSPNDESLDSPRSNMSSGKPKKRNKSVSFMLDDHEEVVVKRTKSDDSIKVNKKSETTAKLNVKDKRKNIGKFKKDHQSEKENKAADVNNQIMDVDSLKPAKLNKAKKLLGATPTSHVGGDAENHSQEVKEKKKKFKKVKKQKAQPVSEVTDTENNNNEVASEVKSRKPRKKKQAKPPPADIAEVEDEPAAKSRKKEPKPDIAEDLENLSIGDNAHTLTNLLDEMTVVDKDKRKKMKAKFNKKKKPKGPAKDDAEKGEEVKEKIKWKKRKWNKDKKGDADEVSLANTVVIENLPLSVMLNYRKLLTDHFLKSGPIKKIGIAEVYPTQESKPVFTTTITFGSDGAAEQALKENKSQFEGSRIRVKPALPATETTVVVRSYADMTDQALSTLFLGAGKIRNIRHLVKGKKTMSTAFVEFDGPEAVDRAIKTAGDSKIGGKKIHLAKFEIRGKKIKKHKNDGDSAADADSEDSND